MNRFLYAEGNPWSMVDPSGHGSYYEGGGCGPGGMYCGSTGFDQQAKKNANQVANTGNPHDHDSQNSGPAPQSTPQSTPYQCSSSVCNAFAPAMPVETSWVAPTYSEWMASGRDDSQVDAYLDAYGAQAYVDLLTGNYTAKNAGTVQYLAREYLILLARRTNNQTLLASIPTNPLFASPLAAGTEDFATQVSMDPLDFGYLAIGLWGGFRSAKGSGGALQPVQGSIQGAEPTRSQISTLISDTAQQVSDLGADYLDSRMSPEQRAASDAQPWLKPLYRGTIVHNETAERLRGIFGSDNFSYSTKGPDFTVFGQDYELTTVGGQGAHENKYRDQYPDLMYPTYILPGT